MKNVTASKYSTRRYTYRGVVIERTGIEWMLWPDFVTQSYWQPRAGSLQAARTTINGMVL